MPKALYYNPRQDTFSTENQTTNYAVYAGMANLSHVDISEWVRVWYILYYNNNPKIMFCRHNNNFIRYFIKVLVYANKMVTPTENFPLNTVHTQKIYIPMAF